jgi:hypothetical protein
MKKIFCSSVLLLTYSVHSFGQAGLVNNNVKQALNQQTLSNFSQFDRIYTTPPADPDVVGSPYLWNEWREGVFLVKEIKKPYVTKAFKYDLLKNVFEFKFADTVKILSAEKVDEFVVHDPLSANKTKFVNLRTFNNKSSLEGFGAVLSDQEPIQLLKKYFIFVQKPTYNATLMVGDKNKNLLLESDYFLHRRDVGYTLVKKKSDLKKYFTSMGIDPGTNSNFKNLKFSDEQKLIELIVSLNSSK